MKSPSPKYKVNNIVWFQNVDNFVQARISYVVVRIGTHGSDIRYSLEGWHNTFLENKLFKSLDEVIKNDTRKI